MVYCYLNNKLTGNYLLLNPEQQEEYFKLSAALEQLKKHGINIDEFVGVYAPQTVISTNTFRSILS